MVTDLKDRYDFDCPRCDFKQTFAPSLAMRDFGLHGSGHGRCLKCGMFLHLEISEDGDKGVAVDWDEWIETQK